MHFAISQKAAPKTVQTFVQSTLQLDVPVCVWGHVPTPGKISDKSAPTPKDFLRQESGLLPTDYSQINDWKLDQVTEKTDFKISQSEILSGDFAKLVGISF